MVGAVGDFIVVLFIMIMGLWYVYIDWVDKAGHMLNTRLSKPDSCDDKTMYEKGIVVTLGQRQTRLINVIPMCVETSGNRYRPLGYH